MASDRRRTVKHDKVVAARASDQRRKEIGIRIRQLREARGLAQPDVAEGVGVTRAAVSQWERGQVDIKTDRLAVVADFLRCSLEWLQLGQGKPPVDMHNPVPFEGNRRRAAAFVNAGKWSKKISQPPFFGAVPQIGMAGNAHAYSDHDAVSDWFRLPENAVKSQTDKLRILRVASGDLKPLINRGDYVVVDTSVKVPTNTDDIFAFNIGIATVLKQVHITPGRHDIIGLKDGISKNATIHRVPLKKLNVVGRVVQLISNI